MSAAKLEREVVDFVLWLTPCGEVTENPTVETIGKAARKLYKKIKKHEAENSSFIIREEQHTLTPVVIVTERHVSGKTSFHMIVKGGAK